MANNIIITKLKDFTRGGQMTMHGVRMIIQASKYVIKITFFLSIALYFSCFFKLTSAYERYLTAEYLLNQFTIGFAKQHYYESTEVKMPDNKYKRIMVGRFINSKEVQKSVANCKKAVYLATLIVITSAVLLLIILTKIFMARSKKLSSSSLVRGSSLVGTCDLIEIIAQKNQRSDFTLAKVPLVKDSETQHILLTGTVGTGKSVALTELLDQVREKKQKAIVYDCDGTYISSYYRQNKDLILNPLDQRSPIWNIWQECKDSADFEAFAESLMPLHLANTDPFWINAARTIFSTAAFTLKQREENPTTRKLLAALLTESLDSIKELVKNTVAESLVSEKIEKTALSVKATLSTHCKSLLYLKDETNNTNLFSIRKWVRDDNCDNWLFIATNKEKAPALRPLISAWLDVAARSVLSLSKSFDRRLWFFVDELPSLYQLPSLKEVLAEGRKFGACFAATIQDIHQLRIIYGREATEALLSLFNTKLCFRTGSTESAEWAERAMGLHEIIDMREGYSYGANDIRDGVTLQQERRKEPIVMGAQFLELDKLEAYLRLPGNFPVAKVKFTIKKRLADETPLIEREMTDVLILAEDLTKGTTSNVKTQNTTTANSNEETKIREEIPVQIVKEVERLNF